MSLLTRNVSVFLPCFLHEVLIRHTNACNTRSRPAGLAPLLVPGPLYGKASIRSRMEYACAVWSGGSTRSLQRLQDSFAKRLGLTLLPLKNRFNYHTLVLFYKIRQNLAPKYLCSLVPDLSSTTSGYSFRKFSYPVPLTKKSTTLESFLPRAIILWNDLPTNVQSSKARSRPLAKLRVHLSL